MARATWSKKDAYVYVCVDIENERERARGLRENERIHGVADERRRDREDEKEGKGTSGGWVEGYS